MDAQVQRQPVVDLVIILHVEGQIALSQADLRGEGEGAARRSAEEQIAPCQSGVTCRIRLRAVLRAGLEHIVLEADQIDAEIQRVLAANQGDIVVPLVVVGSNVRGTVARIAQRGIAAEGHYRQTV